MLKNKCCLYVIISIRFFTITICNLLIEFPSYIAYKTVFWFSLQVLSELFLIVRSVFGLHVKYPLFFVRFLIQLELSRQIWKTYSYQI